MRLKLMACPSQTNLPTHVEQICSFTASANWVKIAIKEANFKPSNRRPARHNNQNHPFWQNLRAVEALKGSNDKSLPTKSELFTLCSFTRPDLVYDIFLDVILIRRKKVLTWLTVE